MLSRCFRDECRAREITSALGLVSIWQIAVDQGSCAMTSSSKHFMMLNLEPMDVSLTFCLSTGTIMVVKCVASSGWTKERLRAGSVVRHRFSPMKTDPMAAKSTMGTYAPKTFGVGILIPLTLCSKSMECIKLVRGGMHCCYKYCLTSHCHAMIGGCLVNVSLGILNGFGKIIYSFGQVRIT